MFIAQMLLGLSIKLHKEIIEIRNNMVKNPNRQEADQLAIYKRRETTPADNNSKLILKYNYSPDILPFKRQFHLMFVSL